MRITKGVPSADNAAPRDAPRVVGTAFAEVRSEPSLSVRIAELIAEAIDEGRLSAGGRLPPEIELAAQFGVSRVTVREALSCLRFVGHLESRQGSGTWVSASPKRQPPRGGHGLKGMNEIIEVLEARLVVEPVVIGVAALDPAPAGLRVLQSMIHGMRLALDSKLLQPQSDFRVHDALIRVCRNKYLAAQADELLERCSGPLWSQIQESTWAGRNVPTQWLEHHLDMAQAVRDGKATEAERLARAHLVSVVRNVGARAPLSGHAKARIDAVCVRFDP